MTFFSVSNGKVHGSNPLISKTRNLAWGQLLINNTHTFVFTLMWQGNVLGFSGMLKIFMFGCKSY